MRNSRDRPEFPLYKMGEIAPSKKFHIEGNALYKKEYQNKFTANAVGGVALGVPVIKRTYRDVNINKNNKKLLTKKEK